MIDRFKEGDEKTHSFVVGREDFARFDSGLVHELCSTFKLAREMEWAARLFVLDIKEEEEEGIGTFLQINHENPAFENERVDLVAEYEGWRKGELRVKVVASVGERLVASGRTGQRVIKKGSLERRLDQIRNS